MKKYIILSICIAIFTNGPSWAETYFVSQSGSGSKDGRSYENRALLAVHNSGAGVFKNLDGDTVYLCGDITSKLYPPDSGEKGAEVTYNGDCSTQDATASDYVYKGTGIAVEVDANFLIFSWLHISSGKQGIYLKPGVNNIHIRNSYITGANEGIWINQANNITIGGREEYSNLIKDLGVHTAYEDIAISGTYAKPAHSITISYNELAGDGSSKGTDGIMVDSAHNDDIGSKGREVIIEHNFIHDHYRENEIDFKGGGHYIIRKNIIKGPDRSLVKNDFLIHFQVGCDHVYMYGNIVRNHDEAGILIWDRDKTSNVEHIYLWSNLIYNMDYWAIGPNESQNNLSNIRFWNLTVVDNGKNPFSQKDTGITIGNALANADTLKVYNSIFAFNRDGQRSSPRRQLHTQGTSNFEFDYNQYYSNDGAVQIFYEGRDVSFSNWNDYQDSNSIVADPGFTDRPNDDYTTKTNLLGAEDGPKLRSWHLDADKGLDEDSDINPQQCGNTPGGFARCAKGLSLADRDNFNDGNWGKGAFVFGSRGVARAQINKLEVRNLRVKP